MRRCPLSVESKQRALASGRNLVAMPSSARAPSPSRSRPRFGAVGAIVLSVAFVLITLAVRPAAAYVDISPTLGELIKDASSITVLRVEKTRNDRGIVVFRKVADLKGQTDEETVRHHVAHGYHPREPRIVNDWAEPGKLAVCFIEENVGILCIGHYWYEVAQRSDGWWTMTSGRPELSLAYFGAAEKLHAAVRDILADKEVVITAVNHGSRTDVYQYNNVAFQKVLRGKDCPVWRIKASLKMPNRVWKVGDKDSNWVVGPGMIAPADVPQLAELLADKDSAVRVQAAEDLSLAGWKGRPALPALRKACDDEHPLVRVHAARAVALISEGAELPLPVLTAALGHERTEYRKAAAAALSDLDADAKGAVPALRSALRDSQAAVRWAAADALGRIGEEAEDAVPALVDLLQDEAVRAMAADALGAIGHAAEAAVPGLLLGIQDKDDDFRWTSAVALSRIDPKAAQAAIPIFVDRIRDGDLRKRWDTWKILTLMGLEAKDAAPALRDSVLISKNGVAAETFACISGPDGHEALPILIDILAEDWNTAPSIAKIGVAAIEPLLEVLKDPEQKDKQHLAAEAIGLIAIDAEEAMPHLLEALRHQNPAVRRAAAHALAELDDVTDEVASALDKSLADGDPNVRIAAARALRNAGDSQSALAALKNLLGHHDECVRRASVVALGNFDANSDDVIESLRALQDDADALTRVEAIFALARITDETPDREGVETLIKALKAKDVQARREAAYCLGLFGEEIRELVVGPLTETMEEDEAQEVRKAAAQSLRRLGDQ